MRGFLIGALALLVAGPVAAGTIYECKFENVRAKIDGKVVFVLILSKADNTVLAMDSWSFDKDKRPDPIATKVRQNTADVLDVSWATPNYHFGTGGVTELRFTAVIQKSDLSYDLNLTPTGDVRPKHYQGHCAASPLKE